MGAAFYQQGGSSHLVDAPSSLEAQLLGHLLPHALVGDPGLAAQLVDDLEEAVEIHLTPIDHGCPVDRGSSVLHVLVQLSHLGANVGISYNEARIKSLINLLSYSVQTLELSARKQSLKPEVKKTSTK